MPQRWAADDAILADVGTVLRSLGGTAESVCAAGRRAFAHRLATGSPPLAVISYDSLLDDTQLREATAPRTLEFAAAALSVEIEVNQDRLVGQLIPPAVGSVEMITLAEHRTCTETDTLGCFTLPLPAPGPVRFRCRAGTAEMLTDWVRL
jgi:hypothetical protein